MVQTRSRFRVEYPRGLLASRDDLERALGQDLVPEMGSDTLRGAYIDEFLTLLEEGTS
jgi:hypothetical protein